MRAHSQSDAPGRRSGPACQAAAAPRAWGNVQGGLAGEEISQQPAHTRVSLSTPAGPVAAIVRELRCMCLTTTPGIHPKMVSNLKVIAPGPQCSKVEVV